MTQQFILVPITARDLSAFESLARFYLYEMSRYCHFAFADYAWPEQKLIQKHYFVNYIHEEHRRAFFIKANGELAGFSLLNRITRTPGTDWKMAEFFVLPKFQGQSIGSQAAFQVFNQFSGKWEVSVLSNNIAALAFWQKVIAEYTNNNFRKEAIENTSSSTHHGNVLFIFESA